MERISKRIWRGREQRKNIQREVSVVLISLYDGGGNADDEMDEGNDEMKCFNTEFWVETGGRML